MEGQLAASELHVYHSVNAKLRDRLKPLLAYVLSQLHGKASWHRVLRPFVLCKVNACTRLDVHHVLTLTAGEPEQVSLSVDVVDIV